MAEDEIDIYLNLHVKDIEGTLGEAIENPEGSFGADTASDVFEGIAKALENMYEQNEDFEDKELKSIIEGLMKDSQNIERALSSILDQIDDLDDEDLMDNVRDILGEVNFLGNLNELMLKLIGEDTDITKDLTILFDQATALLSESAFVNKDRYDELIGKLSAVSQDIDEGGTYRDKMEFINLLRQIPTPSADIDTDAFAKKITDVRDRLEGRLVRDEEGNIIRRRALRVDDLSALSTLFNEMEQNIGVISTERDSIRDEAREIRRVVGTNFPPLVEGLSSVKEIIESWKEELTELDQKITDSHSHVANITEVSNELVTVASRVKEMLELALSNSNLSEIFKEIIDNALREMIDTDTLTYTLEGAEVTKKLIRDITSNILASFTDFEKKAFTMILSQIGEQSKFLGDFIRGRIESGKGLTANMIINPRGEAKTSLIEYMERLERVTMSFTEMVKNASQHDITRMLEGWVDKKGGFKEMTDVQREVFSEVLGEDVVNAIMEGRIGNKADILDILTNQKLQLTDEDVDKFVELTKEIDYLKSLDITKEDEDEDVLSEEMIYKMFNQMRPTMETKPEIVIEPEPEITQFEVKEVDFVKPPMIGQKGEIESFFKKDEEEFSMDKFSDYFNRIDEMFTTKFKEYETSMGDKYIQKVDNIEKILGENMGNINTSIQEVITISNTINHRLDSMIIEGASVREKDMGVSDRLKHWFKRGLNT